jgi:hypothetical protein
MSKFEVRFFAIVLVLVPSVLTLGWANAAASERFGVTTVQRMGAR